MYPKLQKQHGLNWLRPPISCRGLLGNPAPHLLYANLEFGRPDTASKARSILEVPGWDDARSLEFLAAHQGEFRRCLNWLSNGSGKNLDSEDDGSDEFWGRMREMWQQEPEVRFLQQHGLEHAKLVLQPCGQDGSSFDGLQVDQIE